MFPFCDAALPEWLVGRHALELKEMGMFFSFIVMALDLIFVGTHYQSMNIVSFSVAFIVPVVFMTFYTAYQAKQENKEQV